MNVFIVLNRRFPRIIRNYKESYVLYSKKTFTTEINRFLYHRCDPRTMQQQKPWDNRSAVVYPNMISEIEETKLVSTLASKFQR